MLKKLLIVIWVLYFSILYCAASSLDNCTLKINYNRDKEIHPLNFYCLLVDSLNNKILMRSFRTAIFENNYTYYLNIDFKKFNKISKLIFQSTYLSSDSINRYVCKKFDTINIFSQRNYDTININLIYNKHNYDLIDTIDQKEFDNIK